MRSVAQIDDGGSSPAFVHGGVGEALYEGMIAEAPANGRSQRAGAATVDEMNFFAAFEERTVDFNVDRLGGGFDAETVEVGLKEA